MGIYHITPTSTNPVVIPSLRKQAWESLGTRPFLRLPRRYAPRNDNRLVEIVVISYIIIYFYVGMKILLYFWKYLCYDGRAGYGRYIIMPIAQFEEKPKNGFHYPPTWLLGNIIERWKTQ